MTTGLAMTGKETFMEEIKFIKRPRLKSPYLICAWPGMGDVAFKAASHLVEQLKAQEFAEILPEDFFFLTSTLVRDGLVTIPEFPKSKFYFWKNKGGAHDVIVFISNAQPDLTKAEAYFRLLMGLAKSFRVVKVIGFAAMPQPIDHTQNPQVWCAATSPQVKEELKTHQLNMLAEGAISGMNGLFLGIAKREGLDGFCLLGETPLYTIQIENPKASFAVLTALCRILSLRIDLGPLLEQAHVIEEQINKLLDYLKVGTSSEGPIGEEEIERIKKSLTQLTKLPASIKAKIEKLFAESRSDISRAPMLKAELDTWNVYKDYEDQFLDLFKKTKEQRN
jgi:proteasome assembly chaperone (PAC2) family protein